MDYKDLVNCSAAPCALVSAEITEDSQRGAIRIACGNKAFCDIVGPGFYENMYCKDLAAADSNFEDLCVRSAVMGQRVHTYTHDEASGHWMDLTFFPLVPKNDGMGYCLLFADASDNPDPERMAAVSMDTASAALKASLALMGSDDLRESVRQILDDI